MHSQSMPSFRTTLCTGSLLLAALALAAALISGCSSSAIGPAGDAIPDSGLASGDQGSGPGPAGPWSFVPDPVAGPSAAALEVESIEGNRAWLRLVLEGVPELQGIAFRLRFQPDRLEVKRSEQGPGWGVGSGWFPTAARFASRPAGELWGGIGFVGAHALDATEKLVLARIEVQLTGAGPIPLSFPPRRNLVIDQHNRPVPVSWRGGTFRRTE